MNLQPVAVKEAMFNAIARVSDECSAWALCNILWGLSKMGYSWIDLPISIQESIMRNIMRIGPDMKYLDSGILLFSLGNLRAPLDTLSKDVMNSIFESTSRTMHDMRPQELSNVIWGFAQGGLSWDALPYKMQVPLLILFYILYNLLHRIRCSGRSIHLSGGYRTK